MNVTACLARNKDNSVTLVLNYDATQVSCLMQNELLELIFWCQQALYTNDNLAPYYFPEIENETDNRTN